MLFLGRRRRGLRLHAPAAAYDPDAVIYWGAHAGSLTAARKTIDSNLFAALKAAGLFSTKFDALYVFAHEIEALGLRNLIKRSHDCTIGVQPTWVANQGYTGNTTSMYLRTNYVPSTQGVNYSLNSASLGAYCRTNVAVNGADIGANDGLHLLQVQARSAANASSAFVNQTSSASGVLSTDSRGLNVATRRANNTVILAKNGVETSFGLNSSAVVGRELYVCCRNGSGTPGLYTNRELAVVFAGGGLTAQQNTDLFNIIEAYLDSFGAGVI